MLYLVLCKRCGSGGSLINKCTPSDLSKDANKLLRRHRNHVDAASSEYLRHQMEGIQRESIKEMHLAGVVST